MPWLALRLIGLRSLAGRAFAWATANTARMLAIALCASLVVNVWCWHGWSAEQDGRALDRQAYRAAQIEAQRLQDRADWANFTTQTERNSKLEQSHAIAETNRRSDVAAYVEHHRLPAQTCRASGLASPAAVHPDSGTVADSTTPADMVAISPADLDKLAKASMQGAEASGFLNGLVEQGLGVPVE